MTAISKVDSENFILKQSHKSIQDFSIEWVRQMFGVSFFEIWVKIINSIGRNNSRIGNFKNSLKLLNIIKLAKIQDFNKNIHFCARCGKSKK